MERADEADRIPWSVQWHTVPEMLDDVGRKFPDTEAVVDGAVRLTYAELMDRARRVAWWLHEQGIRANDPIGIWADNSWRFVVTAAGIWLSGATIVPLNTRLRGFEAGEVLRITAARALFVVGASKTIDYIASLEHEFGAATTDDGRAFEQLPNLKTLVSMSGEPREDAVALTQILSEVTTASDPVPEWTKVDGDDPCDILYTSGSTGKPKGVVLTHRKNLQNIWDCGEAYGLRFGDRFLSVIPFSHGGGLNYNLLNCLIRGATIIPIAVFDPVTALELIEAEKVTIMLGPPPLFVRMLGVPGFEKYDLSSLRTAITGATSVPPVLVEEIKDQLGVQRVANFYGLIEGATVSGTREEDDLTTVATTSGRPLPNVAVRIVDADGSDAETGEAGEILVRHPFMMAGYLDPEQTAEAVDAEGWLHTGDVGVIDAKGNLAIVGRLKEVFIVGGFNAYPAEVEALILRHPAIEAVAVVGVPDQRLGEVGYAFVVLHPGSSLSEQELMTWAKDHMANYKVPRGVTIADALPVNNTGKVDKPILRERALSVVQGPDQV